MFMAACSDDGVALVDKPTVPAVNDTATALPTPSPSATATPVAVAKGSLTVEPDHGDCGRFIAVHGQGFQAGATIQLTLVIGSRSFSLGGTGTITIPADGTFVHEAPLLRYPECRHGEEFRILATDTRVPRTSEDLALIRMPDPAATYTVGNPSPPATLTLSPASGPCDATIEVMGAGLPPHTENVQVGLLGPLGSDHPGVVLGKGEVDGKGQFRVQIKLGADGCSFTRGVMPAPTLLHLPIGVYDATFIPMLPIGMVEYAPTASDASPEGGDHRNPRWTDRICCI